MDDHPPSYLLEEVAAGAGDSQTEKHVGRCEACREYVARMRRAADEFAATEPSAEQFADRVAAGGRASRRSGLIAVGSAVALIAAAAAVFMILRPAEEPVGQVAMVTATSTATNVLDDPEGVRFKGAPQLAVVRERGGQQERLSAQAGIRPWDRLRVEVSVDALTLLEVGVLSENGEWVTLLPPTKLAPGTHLTPQAVRFDDRPSSGWVLAGTPEAVLRARTTKVFDGVAVMRLHVENER